MSLTHFSLCTGIGGIDLAASEHLTSESGCLYLPTPAASDGEAWMMVKKTEIQKALINYYDVARGKPH